MKKIFVVLALFLLVFSAKAQDVKNSYSFDKIHNTIEFDITNISLFEQRTHFLYLLNNDERFELSTSDKDGVFVIKKSKNSYNFNLEDTFAEFYKEENSIFSNMSKDEVGELYKEWKASLPDNYNASMMMDVYVRDRQNNHCADADPFCTDNGIYQFPAGVNAGSGEGGPNYNCLSTTPNPAWYYMKMANSGGMTIHMYSTPSEDIDYCCWGPFDDPVTPCPSGLTGAKVVSCSYSPNATENCVIPNSAQSGQYYILVITNFSNHTCNITFSKTAGTGTTDCSIMPPLVNNDGPYCVGETISLTGNAPSGATYSWSGPGGWTASGANVTRPNCTMAMAGTYICTISLSGQTSSAETQVVVAAQPTANFNATTVCIGNATQFTSTSTTNPSGQAITSYAWDFGDGQTSTQQNPSHTYANPGNYSVTLTVGTGGHVCSSSKTNHVIVNDQPVANAGNDSSVNFNNPATLTAGTVSGATYAWTPAEKISGNPNQQTVQTVPLVETTTFTLTVTKNGCSDSDQVTISVGAQMTASATIEDNELCDGNSTSVTATASGGNGNYTYAWESSRPVTFSNPNEASTNVDPQGPGEYVLTCVVNDGQTTMRPQVNLTVNPAENIDITEAVCPSELPYILELPDGTTQSFTEGTGASGWHKTVMNTFGCNVNVSLYLTVNEVVENEYTYETCDEPFTFIDNGQVIKVLDHTCVFDTVYPYGDCEKHATIHFTRHYVYDHDNNLGGDYVYENYPEHHCNSYQWPSNGQTYDSWGNYKWTFESIHGCDSIVTLVLDENNLSFIVDGGANPLSVDTCKNEGGFYLWGAEQIWASNSSTPYSQIFPNASTQGCDSIGYLNIRLYERPNIEALAGDQLVQPGSVFMPFIYEYQIMNISGAGTEHDYPLSYEDYTWEILSYYNTPNRLNPNTDDYTSTWLLYPDENNINNVYLYTNAEGNAVLRCTIQTLCGPVSIEKFLYTAGYQAGEAVDELNYADMVNVYPNPTNGDIYIGYSELLTAEPLIISIYSYNGALLDQFYGNSDRTMMQYSMGNMPNGLYLVRFTGSDFVVTKRFVLSK